MSRLRIDRRSALRMGGVALALPLLEAMLDKLPRAAAEDLLGPKRFVLIGGATSTGTDNSVPEELPGTIIPASAGPDYVLPNALAPLAGVKSHLSVVSGLAMTGGIPGAVTYEDVGHGFNNITQLTGMTAVYPPGLFEARAQAPTADELFAPQLAGSTTYASLHLRVQAGGILNNYPIEGIMSWKRTAAGTFQANTPNSSPLAVFQTIMGNSVSTGIDREGHLQVVDRVKTRAEALAKKLGKADQTRLDQHLAEVRDLERRIGAAGLTVAGACQLPANPGEDPAVVGFYADENLRAKTMADLLHMALVCDATRIATLQLTIPFEELDMSLATGGVVPAGKRMHMDINHQGTQTILADAYAWHMTQYAYFVQRCADTVDPSGKSLLDSMAVLYVAESGFGNQPAGGGRSHVPENMQVIVAGKGGDLTPGSHIQAIGVHPGSVVLTAMRAIGYAGDLGDVTTEVAGLRAV